MLRIVLALVSLVIFVGCTSSSGGGSGYTYQGAGSKYSASFAGGAFTINYFDDATSTTPDLTILGTYVDFANGFRKLTVTSSVGAGGPTAGDQAYGFEVPGFAFFLKPVGGSNEEPIVMIQAGGCPTTDFTANWIIASFDNGVTLDATQDSFGHATFDFSGASSQASIHQLNAANAADIVGTPAIAPFDYTSCSNGVVSFEPQPGETVDMFFTSSGGALVHSYDGGGHDNIIFAAPKHSGAVAQADMAGTYSALVFDDGGAPGDKLFPGKLTVPAAGNLSFQEITDVETDAVDPTTVQVDTITAVGASNGLFTGRIDPGGNDGRMSCTFFVFNGTKIIACNGYNQNNTEPFFLLGKSR